MRVAHFGGCLRDVSQLLFLAEEPFKALPEEIEVGSRQSQRRVVEALEIIELNENAQAEIIRVEAGLHSP